MLGRLRGKLTYANVTATLALFLALTGGLAYALESNSVASRHIKNEQVKSVDIRNGQIQSSDINYQARPRRLLMHGPCATVTSEKLEVDGIRLRAYFTDTGVIRMTVLNLAETDVVVSGSHYALPVHAADVEGAVYAIRFHLDPDERTPEHTFGLGQGGVMNQGHLIFRREGRVTSLHFHMFRPGGNCEAYATAFTAVTG